MVPVTVAKMTRLRVIHLSGEIDASTVDLFVREIEPHLDMSNATIVLDLSQVTFLGTVGLKVLAQAERRVNRAGSKLRLVGATTAVQRSLEMLDALRA
ncbi:anti-sigma B factor antagonist [Lentzea aerocolonigenes]|nr:anti-sigma B factor antagonist [Lentzea aerocolonigenes]